MTTCTIIFQKEKSMPGYKAARDCMTLLLMLNAEGDYKLKLLLLTLPVV